MDTGAFREHVLDHRGRVVKVSSCSSHVNSGNLKTIKMHDIFIRTRMAIETL
jgi:hypothetical protein